MGFLLEKDRKVIKLYTENRYIVNHASIDLTLRYF